MDPKGNNHRKAVGSIIGGVFLLLIFTSIMSSVFVIDSYRNTTNELYIERQTFENEKLNENVDYLSVTKKPDDYLNITVINSGNIGTEIVYVGEINMTSHEKVDAYHRVDLFLNPFETAKDITENKIRIRENDTTKLLLLTSYGNIYYYIYNDEESMGTGGQSTFYDLIITTSGYGTTNPGLGMHSYSEGSDADVYAYPDFGWSFSYWMLDNTPAGTDNPITVSMDNDHELEAIFTQDNLVLLEDYFDNFDNWESTSWEIVSDEYSSAGTSTRAQNNNEGDLQSIRIDTSTASQLNILFWYRLSGNIDPNDVDVMLYDGSGDPDTIADLNGLEDAWRLFNYTTTDSQYFISDFYIQFNANLKQSETVWIDDLTIMYTP